jgi:alcohol dehydrogenase
MRAGVFRGVREPIEIDDVEKPDCGPEDVVVRTEACGICRSDWHGWNGDLTWIGMVPEPGQIFGHEAAGVVVEAGSEVTSVSDGDRITTPFNLSCGNCAYCRDGHTNACNFILALGFLPSVQGAWAEEFTVKKADVNAVPLPDDVDPVDAAGMGCRFATAFHGITHQAEVSPGDWVSVHGCGGIGLSAVQIANAVGANVVAVDIQERKLDVAKDLGAVESIDASQVDDVGGAVEAVTDGGSDVSVDALGVEATCRDAIAGLGKRGTHLQLGLTTQEEEGEIPLPVDRMVISERRFVGSFGMPPHRFDEMFAMMASDKLDPGAIVAETVTLDDVPDVIRRMGEFDTIGFPVIEEF